MLVIEIAPMWYNGGHISLSFDCNVSFYIVFIDQIFERKRD